MQCAATANAPRCVIWPIILHRTAPPAARGTETEKPRTNYAVRGFWEFISGLNSKAWTAFGSLLSLDHHLFTIDDVDTLLGLGQSLAGYIIDGSVGVAF